MIPVIVGAAAVGVGAALLSDNDKNAAPEQTRQRVSEDTVKRAMARSGRKIHTVDETSGKPPVFEAVRKIIAEQLGISVDEVQPDSHFIEDLGADSLDIVELIMAFEEEFNIEIADEKAEKIRTVGDAVRLISSGGD